MKNLSKLLENVKSIKVYGDSDFEITGVEYNSQKIEPGMLFTAISGTNTDGHKYIAQALNNGAVAVICERMVPELESEHQVCCILVENSRKALAEIAHAYFEFPADSLQLYGITGTNGKTTTTFILKSIFEAAGLKTGLIGTTGNYSLDRKIESTHTTPESLELAHILNQMKRDGVTHVVMETSSHALHQGRLHGLKFRAGMFSNLTHDHLDYHSNMEEYAQAKRILFENIASDGVVLVNADSEWADFMLETTTAGKSVKIGSKFGDYLVYDKKLSINGIEFTLKFDGINFPLKSKLLGEFNIDNAALAAATALESGIDFEFVAEGLCKTSGAPGRMSVVPLKNGAIGVVDYAHTPDALEKALKASRGILNQSGVESAKLICIFGCGGDRDPKKRSIMGRISTEIANYSIITSDNPRTEAPEAIIQDILQGVGDTSSRNFEVIEDRETAIAHACEISQTGDLILVAGKGHETYQIIGTEKHHFDDSEELMKYS